MNSVTPILSLSEAMNEMLKHPDNSPRPIDVLTPQESADLAEGYLAIESRSRALMRFVNDFRSLTKLPEPNISTIDPEKLLKPIIALLKPILDSKDIKVTLTVGKDIKNVLADKDLIEQVIINLIKNAIDATDNTDHPEINIEISSRVGKKIISISDNGKGISKENLDKVFVPFFSTKEQGSGIGLSLSQQIMRLHNGTITLKSIEGHGSEFSLIFPK
jgi:signal transduction histidine kinase